MLVCSGVCTFTCIGAPWCLFVKELVHNYEPWSNVACCSFAHLIWQPCRMLGAAADTRTDSNRFNIDRTHLGPHTNTTNSNTITIIIITIITIIVITITIIIGFAWRQDQQLFVSKIKIVLVGLQDNNIIPFIFHEIPFSFLVVSFNLYVAGFSLVLV